ncbi:MAG: hypothetical protein K2N30_01745, partial [Clostridia bacterium]|nr:hypothetical protein [Clostridia bacterium]
MTTAEFTQKLKNLETDGKSDVELYNEISALAMAYGLSKKNKPALKNGYYLSMEFLIGRSFYN